MEKSELQSPTCCQFVLKSRAFGFKSHIGRIVRSTSFFKRVGSVFTLYDMISNKGAVMSRLVSPFVDLFIVRYSG